MKDFIAAIHDPIIAAGIFTLLGAAIGFLATITVTFLAARFENKRHIRELGFRLALSSFKQRIKEQQALAERDGREREVVSLPVFMAEATKVAEIVCNPRLNADEIGKRLSGLADFTTTILKRMGSKA